MFRHYVSLADAYKDDNPIKQSAVKSDYVGLMNNLYYQNIIIGQLSIVNTLTDRAQDLKLDTEKIYNQLIKNMQ